MPLIAYPGACGPSNQQRSRTQDGSRSLNCFVEIPDAGTPVSGAGMYRRPGLRPFVSLGGGPVKALFAQDGRAWGIGGQNFGELLPGGTFVIKGEVAVNGYPDTISSNGAQGGQLLVTAAGEGWIYDLAADTFTRINPGLTSFPEFCSQGLFFDGYFLALNQATGAVQLSGNYDGTTWDGLDFVAESQFSDQVVGMTRTHDNLWLFGTRNTAPWYNSGAGNQTFVPISGALIEHGTGGAFTCVEIDNAPMWLGQDEQGSGVIWRANGYTPTRVSTHAVEYALSRVKNYQQAVAWAYQEGGHTFYMLYVPGLDTTWCYDVATNQWHERDHWDHRYGRSFPYVGVNHCFAWGQHLVGDRQSGEVYVQSMDYATDEVVL